MNFNKKLIALLAIFCVVISAGLVCAEGDSDAVAADTGDQTTVNDDTGADTTGTDDAAGNADTTGTEDAQAQDANSNETVPATNATSNETATNATGNATGNTTDNATGNVTNSTSLPKAIQNFVTGNPILVLAFVIIVGAGAYFYKRE